MAVEGFTEDDLGIEIKQNILKVAGGKSDDSNDHNFLHRRIKINGGSDQLIGTKANAA
ncbi:MAG: hypothetical protein ABW166_12780 [Sedimenticola sp.]